MGWGGYVCRQVVALPAHQTCTLQNPRGNKDTKNDFELIEIVLYIIHHVQEYKQQKALLWHLSLASWLFSVTSPYRHTYLQSLGLGLFYFFILPTHN